MSLAEPVLEKVMLQSPSSVLKQVRISLMSDFQKYEQLKDSLSKDEWRLLQGLAYIFAGVNKPISPLSKDFKFEYGIHDAKVAQQSLIAKEVIDDCCEIKDKGFKRWIFVMLFGEAGHPPKPGPLYKPCEKLDNDLLDS
jgi:hypothetical protein